MRGIAFDTEKNLGVLFFLADSVVGGGISLLCIANNRKKTLNLAIQTLSFISKQFGMDKSIPDYRKYDNLTCLLIDLKRVLKYDRS